MTEPAERGPVAPEDPGPGEYDGGDRSYVSESYEEQDVPPLPPPVIGPPAAPPADGGGAAGA
jgi:hypothetical protein